MYKFAKITSALLFLIPFTTTAANLQVTINAKAVVFTDVQTTAWYATYVKDAASADIVSGYKDASGNLTGRFGPGDAVTVAQALKIAIEGAGYNVDSYTRGRVEDINWYDPYLRVATWEAILFTTSGGAIEYNRPATRAEVAYIFAHAFKVNTQTSIGNRYDDVTASTKHGFEIEALSRDKVVSGDTDASGNSLARFRPTDNVNRAETVKIVMEARAIYGTPGNGSASQTSSSVSVSASSRSSSSSSVSVSSSSTSSQAAGTYDVSFNGTSFTPSTLDIPVGSKVVFRNDSSADLWVASNPHPVHTGLPGFDAGRIIAQGDIYLYTFTEAGDFGYHNHVGVGSGVVRVN